jgi:ribonuclease J
MNQITRQTRQILKSSDGSTNVKTLKRSRDGIVLDPSKKVRIIALGGLYEIGKNTWCFECGDDIMLIDAGLAFPTVDMIGVDLVLPKLNYLLENKHKIRGMIVTHGHEDHIGGIVPMLREVDIPVIYAPGLALALLKAKLKEAGMPEQKTKTVQARETVKVGQYFSVTYVRNNHSIADSFSLIIDTPAGRIVHSGDFKFDHSPIDNLYFDVAALAKAGEEGVTLLISDSTNAEKSGYTPSEKAVIPKIQEILKAAQRKTVITTFASQVQRVKLIMQICYELGKKVSIFGRSMVNLAAISKELGYISIPDNFIVRQEDIHKVAPQDLVILCTGSQGEQFAALSRIARQEHKYVQVEPGDTVIFSASPIPGNEKAVNNLINRLYALGADVLYGSGQGIHVSGHASQEEQKILINLCQPLFFMPCHGEYRMLVKHGEIGVKCGVDPNNILLMDNGDVLQIQDGQCQIVEKVEAGIVMIDNANVGELDSSIMLERRMIASEGLLVVVATIDAYGELMCEPKVYARGLMVPPDSNKDSFLSMVKDISVNAIKESPHHDNIQKLEIDIKSEIHKYVDTKLHRHPLLEVIIMQNTGAPQPRVAGMMA